MAPTTLHLTNAWHPSSGGIRTFYSAMLDAANRAGRHMAVVVPGSEVGMQRVGEFGRIYTIDAPRSPILDRRYRLILPHRFVLPWRNGLLPILRDLQPDLVEICDKYSLCYLAGAIRKGWLPGLKRPTLLGLSCERMDDNFVSAFGGGRAGRAFSRWYMRAIYASQFDAHLANSAYTAQEIIEALPAERAVDVAWVPMGADLRWFSPSRRSEVERARLAGGEPRSVTLLYAGRLGQEKNLGLLMPMMARLEALGPPSYRLAIVGDGPMGPRLRREAAGLAQGRVVFLPHQNSPAALADIYANADLFVHPNPREPFGIGPLEAMASGLPVVLPRAGGVLTYANDANSWLAAPDPADFARTVHAAWTQETLRRRRVETALDTARDYRWNKVTAKIFEQYDAIHARHVAGRDPQAARAALPAPAVVPGAGTEGAA
jgi:glycosyltransferase involved in cell wall biosynthesis